ncbi:4'-phosphopantetheinyl transferase family protein [Streptomyces sp. NPDC051636]|uniref:4'-phosphopantetheinyl transferase family protein n=1 Tax=Streptomyces sp. NPDC051636 TaxID=3365663 RepID=UPI0037BB903A
MSTLGALKDPEIWLLPEDEVDGLTEQAHAVLSSDEHARWARLRTEAARRRHLGARLLCRSVLGAYAGAPPDQFRFRKGHFGRPELDPNPWRLRFNLSHTDGLIACVVTDGLPCGIDVERLLVAPSVVRFGVERLAPAERARLDAAPPAVRSREFVDVWVLKEAYTKALGSGFQYGFDSFQLGPDSRRGVLLEDPRQPEHDAVCWQFALSTTSTGHRLAVAVRRREHTSRAMPMPLKLFPSGDLLCSLPAYSEPPPSAACPVD